MIMCVTHTSKVGANSFPSFIKLFSFTNASHMKTNKLILATISKNQVLQILYPVV